MQTKLGIVSSVYYYQANDKFYTTILNYSKLGGKCIFS